MNEDDMKAEGVRIAALLAQVLEPHMPRWPSHRPPWRP